jgi:hypothetical protein
MQEATLRKQHAEVKQRFLRYQGGELIGVDERKE